MSPSSPYENTAITTLATQRTPRRGSDLYVALVRKQSFFYKPSLPSPKRNLRRAALPPNSQHNCSTLQVPSSPPDSPILPVTRTRPLQYQAVFRAEIRATFQRHERRQFIPSERSSSLRMASRAGLVLPESQTSPRRNVLRLNTRDSSAFVAAIRGVCLRLISCSMLLSVSGTWSTGVAERRRQTDDATGRPRTPPDASGRLRTPPDGPRRDRDAQTQALHVTTTTPRWQRHSASSTTSSMYTIVTMNATATEA